jgi:hypothetical protein
MRKRHQGFPDECGTVTRIFTNGQSEDAAHDSPRNATDSVTSYSSEHDILERLHKILNVRLKGVFPISLEIRQFDLNDLIETACGFAEDRRNKTRLYLNIQIIQMSWI